MWRPLPLLKDDVPLLAKCLIGNRLGLVLFSVSASSQNSTVTFLGRGFRITLTKDDWRKLFPMLREPYWTTIPTSDFYLAYEKTGLEIPSGSLLYDRVVADLIAIFPISYPGLGVHTMAATKDKKPVDDPNVVAIKCSRCGHKWCTATVIPSEEGIRQYSCLSCRNTWIVKMGGPMFNFLPMFFELHCTFCSGVLDPDSEAPSRLTCIQCGCKFYFHAKLVPITSDLSPLSLCRDDLCGMLSEARNVPSPDL